MGIEKQTDSLEVTATVANVLRLVTQDSDVLDKVLLDSLVLDLSSLVDAGVASRKQSRLWGKLKEWEVLNFISSLEHLPQQVLDESKSPPYHLKMALSLLSALVQHKETFQLVQANIPQVLVSVVESCELLNINAAQSIQVFTLMTHSLKHGEGIRWMDETGVWSQLMTTYATSGGGHFKPSLDRLLIDCLLQLSSDTNQSVPAYDSGQLAGESGAFSWALQALRRFLVVPARRLTTETSEQQPWVTVCDLLQHFVWERLQRDAASSQECSAVLRSLAQQVALPMELGFDPSAPARLYAALHLSLSDSEQEMISAVRHACSALCRERDSEIAMRNVASLLLTICLLDTAVPHHLVAATVTTLWQLLKQACEENQIWRKLYVEQDTIVKEFIGEDHRLGAVLHPQNTTPEACQSILRVARKVFLARADRPLPEKPKRSAAAICILLQPWILLLKEGAFKTQQEKAEVLTIIGNLASGVSPSARSRVDTRMTSLLSLDEVIADTLQTSSSTGRIETCTLQCLRCSLHLLPDPANSSASWKRLAELLKSRFLEPQHEDALDAAGEVVARALQVANQRGETEDMLTGHSSKLVETINQGEETVKLTDQIGGMSCPINEFEQSKKERNGSFDAGGKATTEVEKLDVTYESNHNETTSPKQRKPVDRHITASRQFRKSITDWLVLHKLPPLALTALLHGGHGEQSTACDVLNSALDSAASGQTELLLQLQQDADLMQILESGLDQDVVSGSMGLAALKLLETYYRLNWHIPEDHQLVVARYLQTATRSGDTDISGAARRILAESATIAMDSMPVSADFIRNMLQNGTALALVQLWQENPAYHRTLHRLASLVSDTVGQKENEEQKFDMDSGGDRGKGSKVIDNASNANSADCIRSGCVEGGQGLPTSSVACEAMCSSPVTNIIHTSDQIVVGTAASRDTVISSVLAESTHDFFKTRVFGSASAKHYLHLLKKCTEVSLTATEFLQKVSVIVAKESEGENRTDIPNTPPPSNDEDVLERIIRQVTDRVQELFRCALMDQTMDVPIDCY